MTTKAREALNQIHAILDGEEWNSDTMVKVSEVITDFGFIITDPNITDPDAPKPPLPPDVDPQAEYTFDHLESAACMWEHVLHKLRGNWTHWLEYKNAYGMATLRATVIRHAPILDAEYLKAKANGYDKDFDWDFVPKYMEEHMTRILT